MNYLTYFLVVCLFLTACKHQKSKIDYTVNPTSSPDPKCTVPVKKFEIVPDSTATKIGTMKLSDSGFSNRCSEADAIVLLIQEACALNADFINITDEAKPDAQSNCYRCRADFYKFKNANK